MAKHYTATWSQILILPLVIVLCAGAVELSNGNFLQNAVDAVRNIPTMPPPRMPGYGPFGR